MIITVTNQKGGVAKTTTAVSIAHGLARHTQRATLLIDLDQQGQSAIALGMSPASCLFDYLIADAPASNCIRDTQRQRLHLLPGNARTKHVDLVYRNEEEGFTRLCERLTALGEMYAFVVLDTPVAGLLQEAAIACANWVVVPARCEALPMDSVHATLALAKRLNSSAQVVLLPTMYDRRLNEHEYNLNALGTFGVSVAVAVPDRVAVAEAAACGQTVWEYPSGGILHVRQAYMSLLTWILGEVDPAAVQS